VVKSRILNLYLLRLHTWCPQSVAIIIVVIVIKIAQLANYAENLKKTVYLKTPTQIVGRYMKEYMDQVGTGIYGILCIDILECYTLHK